MTELLFMLIGLVLVNVFDLRGLLNLGGRSPVSRGYEGAIALAVTTVPAALIATVVVQILLVLVLRPLGADYLYLLLLVAVSAGATWTTQKVLRRVAPVPASGPSRLVAANSLVIAAMADMAGIQPGIASKFLLACVFAASFVLLLLAMTEFASRLDDADVPRSFKGAPILFVSTGIAALALLGLGGLLPG